MRGPGRFFASSSVLASVGGLCVALATALVFCPSAASGQEEGVGRRELMAGGSFLPSAPDASPVEPDHDRDEHDADHAEHQEHAHDHPDSEPGGARFLGFSLDGMFAAGTSTEGDESLQFLQGGHHDPRKRGFTVQNVELGAAGAVDPYFDAAMYLVMILDPLSGDTVIELEEAFMTTRALPGGAELRVGHYLTEFGLLNPTHPHAWQWQDQPIINTRLFGPDGLRAPGARLRWQLPTSGGSDVHFGVQNANGETMASFLANEESFDERPIGGRPFVARGVHSLEDLLCTFRWESRATTCCGQVTWQLGASALLGPNATGPEGDTQIFGVDLSRRRTPCEDEHDWPVSLWTSEFMIRRYAAERYSEPRGVAPPGHAILPAETLWDWGFYTQVLRGFRPRWAWGIRYEYVSGSGDSLDADLRPIDRNQDPFRDNRHRLSPLLAYSPSEFSRFRFQYNFDYAWHLPSKNAHSFWLGAEFILGAHPAHRT